MSWAICIIGKPENVVAALEAQSERLSGDSKAEYDEALPHMVALVKQNQNNGLVRISGNGHAYLNHEKVKVGSCVVNVETLFGALV
jgi:hypothetical protein